MAYWDGKPVGCCIYGRGRDEKYADWCEIVSLYLLPDVMRLGIGGQLLEEVMRLMRLDGYHKFYLWAIDGNEIADGFYHKHGFIRLNDYVDYKIGGESVRDVCYAKEE